MESERRFFLIIIVFLCGIIAGFCICALSPLSFDDWKKDGKIKYIYTDDAPKPIGPYSQGILCNGFFYTAGQIGILPSGEIISSDLSDQTDQVMKNLKAVLASEGLSFSDVLSVKIYLTDIEGFDVVNSIYGSYFPSNAPARSVIEVSSLPGGAKIEMDMIAVKN
ncbi:MAG: Rid family detoxifying hydrolase [Methanomicrobium sp.]|nr:Rid family detoxifying hydrolase [Methanomicrobium sp.]